MYEYDVVLSFAGSERPYVDRVAAALKAAGIRVFYDQYEQVSMWGKDLYAHLDFVYRKAARYCVLFASEAYARQVWTNHERRSAQARALGEAQPYILPARFDGTEIPGLPETVHYFDLTDVEPEAFAQVIVSKLAEDQADREDFFPPTPDRLFEYYAADDDYPPLDQGTLHTAAYRVYRALRRMSKDEREIVLSLLIEGCPADLPENIHIYVDLLRRITGRPPAELESILTGFSTLGVLVELRDRHQDDEEPDPSNPLFFLEWHNLTNDEAGGNVTVVAYAMMRAAVDGYCEDHAMSALVRLDFSRLSTVTERPHIH